MTELATELRDTVLQDLVAVGMMIQIARQALGAESEPDQVLERARQTLDADLVRLREVICRLGPPA